MVQEGSKVFGYMPHLFALESFVLFPPIESNEVWTVGFIQYADAEKCYDVIDYEGNIKFVFKIKPI